MVAGGCAWLLGGMRGCWGGCVVAGGMHGCWGACVVARGTCVVARGCAWLPGGHVWLPGGVCSCQGHVWLLGGMRRIRRDTVNERAVRIILECILVLIVLGDDEAGC